MPKSLLEKEIADMQVGDTGWAVPWAMCVDEDRQCWLNGKYTIHEAPGGTVMMYIAHTALGYEVDLGKCNDYRWSRGVRCANPIKVDRLVPPILERG